LDVLREVSMSLGGRQGIAVAETLLKEAGFTVSQVCCSRPSCFDFAARKNESLIFIKVQPDIDNLSSNDSLELRDISKSVSAASLLISEIARDKPLEDDTVYSRHNILAVTPKTFQNITIRKVYPLIQAGPGGYYVETDGGAIRRRRQELGLSVGEIAEMIGISRRTLYGYERGMAKASVTIAYNLIYTLGIPVAKPVNIFEKPRSHRKCKLLLTAKHMIAKNKLLMKIFRKSDQYRVTTVQRAPFDFVITIPAEKMRIIGGVATRKEQALDRRVDEILSVSRVVQAHPILITEDQRLSNKDVSCIFKEELSKIKSPEDLIVSIT
jgi:putative transcriptional regulator